MKLDRERAKHIVERFEGVRIAVVGDWMLDHYIWGRVNRISPEAPVPIVEVMRESVTLGGAGNVAMNARALGGCLVVFGVVGDDEAGRKIAEMAKDIAGDSSAHMLLDQTRPSTVKRRVVAHNQHVVRVDTESRAPIGEALYATMLERLHFEIPKLRGVIVSDYNKGVITRYIFDQVAKLCHSAQIPVFLDPKAFDLRNVGPITAITPNEREAETISGIRISDTETLERAGQAILEKTGAKHILVTRGEQGMALFSAGEPPLHLPTQARQVYDVTGAGDTVVAALAMAVAADASVAEAAQLANIAAGIAVGRVGTAAVSRKELLDALDGDWPLIAADRNRQAAAAGAGSAPGR